MKVLLATSGVHPISKDSIIANNTYHLAKSLVQEGVDADVLLPLSLDSKFFGGKLYQSHLLQVSYDGKTYEVVVHKTKIAGTGVDVFLLGSSLLSSDLIDLAFFNKAIESFIETGFNTYDVIHLHSAMCGLTPALLSKALGKERPSTVCSLHTLSPNYILEGGALSKLGEIAGEGSVLLWDLEDDKIDLLLELVASSDFVITPSTSSAKEMSLKDIGGDLSQIIHDRQGRVLGIVPGIDHASFERGFDVSNWRLGKQGAKRKLMSSLGFDAQKDAPLFTVFISEVAANSEILDVLEHVVEEGHFVIVYAVGESSFINKIGAFASKYESNMKIVSSIGKGPDLPELFSGSDFSLFFDTTEFSGLQHLISMWYGALPIAPSLGVFQDTIKEGSTGFLFSSFRQKGFQKTLTRALNVYEDASLLDEMVSSAMVKYFLWEETARRHIEVYQKALQLRDHSRSM